MVVQLTQEAQVEIVALQVVVVVVFQVDLKKELVEDQLVTLEEEAQVEVVALQEVVGQQVVLVLKVGLQKELVEVKDLLEEVEELLVVL